MRELTVTVIWAVACRSRLCILAKLARGGEQAPSRLAPHHRWMEPWPAARVGTPSMGAQRVGNMCRQVEQVASSRAAGLHRPCIGGGEDWRTREAGDRRSWHAGQSSPITGQVETRRRAEGVRTV